MEYGFTLRPLFSVSLSLSFITSLMELFRACVFSPAFLYQSCSYYFFPGNLLLPLCEHSTILIVIGYEKYVLMKIFGLKINS